MSALTFLRQIYTPWRTGYRYMHRMAHEQPVFFYSLIIGSLGPVVLFVVPPVRRSLGYKSPEPVPVSYPVPNRPRRKVEGYDDP